MSILDKKAIIFLENYLNNPSPTGYESEGQKIWMNYLKPYVHEFITDTIYYLFNMIFFVFTDSSSFIFKRYKPFG